MELQFTELERYLTGLADGPVEVTAVRQLSSETSGADALKQFGYGRPLLVAYRVAGREEKIVIHQINRNIFGHERDDDRVAAVWLDYTTFGRLPRHVPAVDMIAYSEAGRLQSIGSARELLLATAFRAGQPYAEDFFRLRDGAALRPLDIERAEALASYLAEIHQTEQAEPSLWRRRLRDLVGHGEGVMGLTDSYPLDLPYISPTELRDLEEEINRWRWRLKPLHRRLRQVHGDFHPFNILFESSTQFHILDRSRGEWGEPADDVSCLTINYLFFSLQRAGRLEGALETLHSRFWERYLAARPDEELTAVIQPWLAWRVLVLASPIWYPTISEETRRRLFTFAKRVLALERYDYRRVNDYL